MKSGKAGIIKFIFAKLWLFFFGYKVIGEVPKESKFIIIGAPHTSNWDLPFGMALLWSFRIKFNWLGKHTLFKAPFGFIMKLLGGIPINRKSAHGVVNQIIKSIHQTEHFALVIAPEGTRKKGHLWKSGFYWIALKAQIPIVCGYADYKKKIVGLSPSFMPTGNVKKDMDKIRDFYNPIKGKYPDQASIIKLKEEN